MDDPIQGYTSYITKQGDTFDILSLEFYGEEKKASLLIRANPDLCDVLIFDNGCVLKVPIVNKLDLPETLPPWRRET